MNILFVNCRFNLFSNIDSGAANRTTLFVKALAQLGHVDVISFYKEPIESNIANCNVLFSKNVHSCIVNENRYIQLINLLFRPFRRLNYYRIDKEQSAVVESFYNAKNYDLIACRYIEDLIGCSLLRYADKLVVDVDDNPVNALKRNLTNVQLRHFWNKWEMSIKLYVLGGVVEQILSNVKISFYSNILESPCAGSVYLHNTTTVSVGIPDITESTPCRMLIVGWLDYFPNRNGALHFVKDIFPLIRKAVPQAELHIAGKCNDRELLDMLNEVAGVKALGYVEDISEEYKNARIIIVPVYQGAGSSVKFVEGLFMNRPIISTPMGVRGFENLCADGIHYLLAKDDEGFVRNAIRLLKSINESRRISHNATQVASNYFSCERFVDIVTQTVKSKFNG